MFWLLNKCKKYNAGVFGRVKEGGEYPSLIKTFVIRNAVKDLFADFTGRRIIADNRSFTTFRMTSLI